MHWQLIVIAGFVVLVALFFTALFLYASSHRRENAISTALRLRSNHEEGRSVEREDCHG
jgi:membrane-associated phospholipid phosphatase